MNTREKVVLFIASVITVGWILFLIFWIFPQIKDSVAPAATSIYGQASTSSKALLLIVSSIFVFLGSFSGIRFLWKDNK